MSKALHKFVINFIEINMKKKNDNFISQFAVTFLALCRRQLSLVRSHKSIFRQIIVCVSHFHTDAASHSARVLCEINKVVFVRCHVSLAIYCCSIAALSEMGHITAEPTSSSFSLMHCRSGCILHVRVRRGMFLVLVTIIKYANFNY